MGPPGPAGARGATGPAAITAPQTDGSYEGITIPAVAGETLAQWDAVYLESDSKAWKADANGTGTYPAVGVVTTAAAADDAIRVLVVGLWRDDAAFTAGETYYLSTTAGLLTTTQPSATDDVIQVVGRALTANVLYVNPSADYMTHV